MTELSVSLNPNQITPGLLGFIVVCIIGIVTWFLFRNMAKHLNKHDMNKVIDDDATPDAPQPR
jgi:hypothetical protein